MHQKLDKANQLELANIYRTHRAEFIAWMQTHYSCSAEEARDIYQETMITFGDKMNTGQANHLQSSTKTCIYGIAKNKYKEYRRRNRPHAELLDEFRNLSEEERQDDADFAQKMKLVTKCLAELGEPGKSILELFYYHGMSIEDIRKHLGYKNIATTKNMKYKCLVRLRDMFLKDWRQMDL